ncbi:MAG: MFS transporter [Anaerolineae bacterium]|nr:MFS transporter [Anaerolineae bacterium]
MLQLWRDVGRDTRLIMISYFLWGIGEGLWMFIQPLYVKSLGASPDQTGFVIGMWGWGRLLFILPVGILADRFGARKLMLPGWFIGFIGVLLITLAPDWRWAAPGFLVYGISASAIPISNLYITQAARHDPTRRPDLPASAAFTLLWAAYSLGIVVTPAIGGWLGDIAGLRTVYATSLFWFTASAVVIMRTRRYPVAARPAQGYDYGGLLRQYYVITAFALLTFGLVGVLVGQTLSSQYLEEVRGLSRTTIGVLGSINALGTVTFSLLLGRLIAWRGFYAALWLVLASFALFLFTGSPAMMVIAVFLLGAHYAARPLATAVIAPLVPEHQRGLAFALVDTLAGLATIIGTNAAGVLYTGNPGWPFVAGIVGIVTITVIGVWLLRTGWLSPPDRNAAPVTTYSEVEATSK